MPKFLFIHLRVRNGEYDYDCTSVHQLPPGTKPDEFADGHASEFYDGKADKEDDGYYFHGGQVHVSVKQATEITEAEYETMRRYL